MNSVKFMKVKIKSLAAEAGIIRLEERRAFTRSNMSARESRMAQDLPEDAQPLTRTMVWNDPTTGKQKSRVIVLHGDRGNKELYRELKAHRKFDVRNEARATLVVYAFMRGKPLSSLEKNPLPWLIASRVLRMVEKYCPDRVDEYKAWIKSYMAEPMAV